ncbi:MAG: tRNA (adenosine(37)-N6)-threonylcarbamoyltransferase complex ATPase subunit type 1 TsaE [Clostridia bacterium]|nr:tRNA (adenosine(37)-N6)-threonylcarbamoyltransferase complex ATPase subunit type 1 TsaE [Clostridia bacterium]
MERTLTLKTEGDMEALGMRIAQALPRGGFVALYGDLGAGKTVLSRGAGRALGLDHLSSPTFTIVQEYPTAPLLFHFDAYRLADEDELYAMGFEDYLDRGGLILMEWADRVPDALPRDRLDIKIVGSGADARTVRLLPRGERYEGLVKAL